MSPDDAQTIEAFLRGEPRAVAVVDRWLAGAAGPFRRRLSSEWEDVMQEARLLALRLLRQGQYRGDSSLRTYLWQVVGHLCIDVLRRRGRRPEIDPGPDVEAKAASDPSPFDHVAVRERDERLLRALEATSAECRAVWAMILSGLSYREMSDRLGTPEGTLRVRAHRCRKAVAEALAGNENTRTDANG